MACQGFRDSQRALGVIMKSIVTAAAIVLCAGVSAALAQAELAPTGTLRAAYLATNPAQTTKGPDGELRGPAADLAKELARRIGKPLEMQPIANPPAVIEAVSTGKADIGFVAYEATRLGTVEFSQTYMLVQQSFLALGESPMRAVADVDRAGHKIGATRNDSMMLCLKRILKQAAPVELDNKPDLVVNALLTREIDAFGANRQRLTTLMKSVPGSRILDGNLFNVPQNVIVPQGRTEAIASINKVIDELRASGSLQQSITRAGAVGVEMAPPSPGSAHGCPN